jgi:uncharacterized protein
MSASKPHRLTEHVIADEAALLTLLGQPADVVKAKVVPRLLPIMRPFIDNASLVLLATADESGRCDVSPRGDPRGFVKIIDDETLLLPERPGNRLADSLRNVISNPQVGLLFIIAGITDAFRVNGRATIITDETLLRACAVEERVPRLGILVDIEQCYTHCSKAFIRSDLWNPAQFVTRNILPTNGEIHRAIAGETFDAETYDQERAARYARREGFY